MSHRSDSFSEASQHNNNSVWEKAIRFLLRELPFLVGCCRSSYTIHIPHCREKVWNKYQINVVNMT